MRDRLSPLDARKVREISAHAILEKAKNWVGSVTHPTQTRTLTLDDPRALGEEFSLDVDRTLEEMFDRGAKDFPLEGGQIWGTIAEKRVKPVLLVVDTSLSMTGEKLALTALAVAIVLLQFPVDKVGLVSFENTAHVIKRFDEPISPLEVIQRIIDVPAKGYTHLEEGLREAIRLASTTDGFNIRRKQISTVLLSDGKYTAGKDPTYLAPRLGRLIVVKMGRERGTLEFCRTLARRGGGELREVPDLSGLPLSLHEVVKDLLRRSSTIR